MDLPAATIQFVRGNERGLDVHVLQEFLGQPSLCLKHPFNPKSRAQECAGAIVAGKGADQADGISVHFVFGESAG